MEMKFIKNNKDELVLDFDRIGNEFEDNNKELELITNRMKEITEIYNTVSDEEKIKLQEETLLLKDRMDTLIPLIMASVNETIKESDEFFNDKDDE